MQLISFTELKPAVLGVIARNKAFKILFGKVLFFNVAGLFFSTKKNINDDTLSTRNVDIRTPLVCNENLFGLNLVVTISDQTTKPMPPITINEPIVKMIKGSFA